MSRNFREWQIRLILGSVGIASFAMLMGLDIMTETDPVELSGVLVDGLGLLLMVSTTVGHAVLVQRMQHQHEEKLDLIRSLDIARAEGTGWRDKAQVYIQELRSDMNTQFERWGMSIAEKDVAMPILKGLSREEIAQLCGTTEATLRQQAQSIYQKPDLPGETAFSANFLEGLIACSADETALPASDLAKKAS